MSEWHTSTLSGILKFGNGKSRPKEYGEIPVYGGNGILDYTNCSNYAEETIVIGRVGAYCGATYYENKEIWVSDNSLSAKALHGNDAKFLYYFLKNLDLNQFAQGSSHPLLTQTLLNSIEVVVPSSPLEQKAIASVLSSLDDKIDLLHRQNKTLETMAETLFRQWFIEGAKEDWEETKVLDVFSLVGGGTPKTSEATYWDGDIPWLSGGDIANAHQGFLVSAEKSITALGLDKSSTKLLPKLASVISARGTVGKYAMLSRPMTFSQSNYGILPKGHQYYYFVYLLLAYIVDELLAAAYGSVFDTITTRTFEDVGIKLPSIDIVAKFESEIAPIFEKKLNNVEQIQTLEKLRDTLLPKLMNGEVTVKWG